MRNKRITIVLSALLAVAIILSIFSFYLLSSARQELQAEQDTNTALVEQIKLLKGNIGDIEQSIPDNSSANKEETGTTQKATEPEKAAAVDLSKLDVMLGKFIHAYYDCDAQRTGAQLMKAIEPHLTDNAKKKYAPKDSGSAAGSMKYQARIEVVSTTFKQTGNNKVNALSVCTLKVTTGSGQSTSTVLLRTNNVLQGSSWKVDTIGIVVTDAFGADRLK